MRICAVSSLWNTNEYSQKGQTVSLVREKSMTGKDLILGLLIFLVMLGIILVKTSEPADVDALAIFQNGKVWVYRVIDGTTVCYVTVGKLHGYTVAINCVQEQECQQKY